jgi:hypothetical protein
MTARADWLELANLVQRAGRHVGWESAAAPIVVDRIVAPQAEPEVSYSASKPVSAPFSGGQVSQLSDR